jgi:hypothetical protein
VARSAVLARWALVALTALLLNTSPAAAAGWGRPFRLIAPVPLDVFGTELAFAPSGAATVGYAVQNADNPLTAMAFTAGSSTTGKPISSRRIGGVQQILALAYLGPNLELLAGTSPRDEPCCSTAETISATSHGFGSPRRLLAGLSGAAVARLVTLPGRLLAAVATEHGVWVSQSSRADRFGSVRRLTTPSALPETLDATDFPRARSVVVWTARPDRSAPGPTQIFISTGSQKTAPRQGHVAITVPSGHRIDELTVARGPSFPTVVWIDSWFDPAGAYHSQVFAADLRGRPVPQPLSSPSELAAGLSSAADARGDQALSWKGCTVTGICGVRAVVRRARGLFGVVARLPAIDPSQTPAVAMSPRGLSLVAWIARGHVFATQAARDGFGRTRIVSPTSYAADLTLAFGPKTQALAAWTQGTLNQSVMGALFNAR